MGITAPTTIDGGTLDINGNTSDALRSEPITIKGNGAIVNNGAGAYNADMHYVTMTGDATVGGTGRWEIGRWTAGGTTVAYLNGNHHKLTKTGTNVVWLNDLGHVDLSTLEINQGEVTIEWDNALVGTVLGTSDGSFLTPITVNAGGRLGMWGPPDAGWGCAQNIAGTGPVVNNSITLNGGTVGATQNDDSARKRMPARLI